MTTTELTPEREAELLAAFDEVVARHDRIEPRGTGCRRSTAGP